MQLTLRRESCLSPRMAAPLTWDAEVNGAPLTWDSADLTWDWELPLTPNTPNTMPNDNRISATVSPADKAAVLTKLTEIKALLPFLLNLTKQERIEMPKMGGASLLFDEGCATYMANSPSLIPPYVDPVEVAKDRALRVVMADILREARKFCEMIDDTLMVIGSEIWMADISFYQSVKQAARRNVLGADTAMDDLKQRFPGPGGDPVTPPDGGGGNPPPNT